MFRQKVYLLDDDEHSSNEKSPYNLSRGKYKQTHQRGYNSPFIEYKSTSLDRISGEMMNNPYATLPHPQPPPNPEQRAKIKVIGVITNMFTATRQANIFEEESNYLEAVESGDLETVKRILLKHEDSDGEEEKHSVFNDDERIIENKSTDSGQSLPEKSSSDDVSKESQTNENSKNNETTVNLEMSDVKETQSQRPKRNRPRRAPNKRKLSTPSVNLWQKGANLGASPLPVSLARQNSFGQRRSSIFEHENADRHMNGFRKTKFDKNCIDQWGRSALFIAMIHQNLDMLQLLLHFKVKCEECIYHAIEFGYYDIVELFVQDGSDSQQMISKRDSFYSPGLTPRQLAAHKNDYVMLRILHSHDNEVANRNTEPDISLRQTPASSAIDQSSVLDRAWDSSNHQLLHYMAISSPAHLVMAFMDSADDSSHNDIFETIFELYAELKNKVRKEPAIRSLYLPLADQVEEFACDLLSEVRSSSDLASLLRFDPPGTPHPLSSRRSHLAPVQRAVEVRMKRFVAHKNTQLAISTLRQGTLFESEHGLQTFGIRAFLGIFFPILCIGFSVFPKSKIGKLLCNPMVNMSCHIVSEITFLMLMIIRLILLTSVYNCDCLGTAPYSIDYVILLWVLARLVNLIKKFRDSPFRELMTNIWVLNDVTTSSLFVLVIILKIYDLASYPVLGPEDCPSTNSSTTFLEDQGLSMETYKLQCTRSDWDSSQSLPITISEAALALIYLLIHIRAMELLYTDRTFGPLQLSLDKMLLDTIRFLIIFFVTFMAFALAMTQLYYAWGRPKSIRLNKELEICEQNADYSKQNCSPVYSYITESLLEQYWTLYGYGWKEEPPSATIIPMKERLDRNKTTDQNQGVTVFAGQAVSMLFHAWAIVVMLNMLVAMMSHSFDRVRNNAEQEWKFHRSVMWMKFIRKGIYPRPPPMNLIPSTRDIKSFYNLIRSRLPDRCKARSSPQVEPLEEKSKQEQRNYRQALKYIVNRYTRRYLLPDFRHKEIDQVLTRHVNRRPSTTADNGPTICATEV